MYIFDICGGDTTGWGYLFRPGIQFSGKIQKKRIRFIISIKKL